MIAIESENSQSMKQRLIEAQADNMALRERLKEVQQYFSNPSKYSGAWPEWYSATIEQLLCKANPGAPLLDELEIYKRALDMALDRISDKVLELEQENERLQGLVDSLTERLEAKLSEPDDRDSLIDLVSEDIEWQELHRANSPKFKPIIELYRQIRPK